MSGQIIISSKIILSPQGSRECSISLSCLTLNDEYMTLLLRTARWIHSHGNHISWQQTFHLLLHPRILSYFSDYERIERFMETRRLAETGRTPLKYLWHWLPWSHRVLFILISIERQINTIPTGARLRDALPSFARTQGSCIHIPLGACMHVCHSLFCQLIFTYINTVFSAALLAVHFLTIPN
jgi:hypothetical protein